MGPAHRAGLTTDAIAEHRRYLKDIAHRATREHGVDRYDSYCANKSIAILPYGTFDTSWTLHPPAQSQPTFQALRIEDDQVTNRPGWSEALACPGFDNMIRPGSCGCSVEWFVRYQSRMPRPASSSSLSR